jgi:class 3 adenylate cyclase
MPPDQKSIKQSAREIHPALARSYWIRTITFPLFAFLVLDALRMAVAMKDAVSSLQDQWMKFGWELGFGVGITSGYATLGAIGFED